MAISNYKQIFTEVKKLLQSVKLTRLQLSDKSLIEFEGEDLTKGQEVYLLIDTRPSPLPDGKYQTLSGIHFTIEKGVISTVDNSKDTAPAKTNQPIVQAMASQKVSLEFADPGYQKDKKQRYPIDTEEHIRAAWNYINKKEDAEQYSAEDLAKVKEAIIRAWKDKIDPQGPPSAQAQASDDSADSTDTAPPMIPSDDSADDSSDLGKLLDEKLAPILEAIKNIETAMCNEMSAQKEATQTAMKEVEKKINDTKTALGKVTEVVEAIAEEPSAKPIEAQKKNQFKIEEKKNFKETEAYKIFHINEKK